MSRLSQVCPSELRRQAVFPAFAAPSAREPTFALKLSRCEARTKEAQSSVLARCVTSVGGCRTEGKKKGMYLCKRPACGGVGYREDTYCCPVCQNAHARYLEQANLERHSQRIFFETDSEMPFLAFYFPDRMLNWDAYGVTSFLSNFYPLETELAIPIHSEEGTTIRRFQTAEAAFQALKFAWIPEALDRFCACITGNEAIVVKNSLRGQEDFLTQKQYPAYNRRGSNWLAMWEVLQRKFHNTGLEDKLIKTGDVLLLEHNERKGRDTHWSDNSDGSGFNFLGMQLMLLRDFIRVELGWPPSEWSSFFERAVNLKTGENRDSPEWNQWRSLVGQAARKVAQH